MIAQSAGGKYGTKTAKAWGWLLPTIVPTLSLVIGSVANQLRNPSGKNEFVDAFGYQAALAVSAFYLFALVGTILVQPLVSGPALDWLQTANLWLAPIQGLTAVMVGVFFQSAAREQKP